MNLAQALADPDPLIRYQARRQQYYELEGFAPDEDGARRFPDRPSLLPGMRELWERNRAIAAVHRARAEQPARATRRRRVSAR